MKKIAIVICTYKRPDMLELALRSLAEQSADRGLFQVLVVDNNSQDETESIVRKYSKEYDNFTYLLETKQGLSHARNCGYMNAEADYVAYMDDDAKANKDYLEKASELIDNMSPDIFGGPIFPFYLSDNPDWFMDKYEYRHTEKPTGWYKGSFSGSNMIFKRELLVENSGFPTEVGMKGNALGYGEETALIAKLREQGKKLYFSQELIMTHFVPELKKSLAYWLYSSYKTGKQGVLIFPKEFKSENLFELAELVDDAMGKFDAALLKRDIERYKYPENYIIEEARAIFSSIGALVGAYQEHKKRNESVTFNSEGDIDRYTIEKVRKMRKITFIKNIFKLIKIYLGKRK